MRNAGHPWTAQPGWDLLIVETGTEDRRDRYVEAAATKFWQLWLRGTNVINGRPRAVLYKPSGAAERWADDPSLNQLPFRG